MSLPSERELIEALSKGFEAVRNTAGLTDDCAVVPLGSTDLVVSTDSFAAPTHFPEGTPPELAGRFAVSAALSDLAAMGGDPLGVLVAYGLPATMELSEAEAVARGVASSLEDHGGELLGADTKPRPVLELTVTAVGQCQPGRAMLRSQAQPGDTMLLTGTVGGAGAALARIQDGLGPEEAGPLLDPTPRVRAGARLAKARVRCAMDTSDGLADAAAAIAQASGVRVVLEAGQIPLHPWAHEAGEEGLAWALSTGGDYELVACVPGELLGQAEEACHQAGVEVTPIGRVEPGQGAVLVGPPGEQPLDRGYQHTF